MTRVPIPQAAMNEAMATWRNRARSLHERENDQNRRISMASKKIEIRNWITGEILFAADVETVREAVVQAVETGARLDGARLVGARLVGARLDGARLDGARLDGARLVGARLVGARLDGARLGGARLGRARLDGARLVGARLDGARLDGARLDGAVLDKEATLKIVGWPERLGIDDRGYELFVWRVEGRDEPVITCGCRCFDSIKVAQEHWGSDTYPNAERGRWFMRRLGLLNESADGPVD